MFVVDVFDYANFLFSCEGFVGSLFGFDGFGKL